MRFDIWVHHPDWWTDINQKLDVILAQQRFIMSSFDDLTTALASVNAKVSVVKADVETLLAKLAAVPTGGLDHVQQAALDAAVLAAKGIADSLSGIDTEVNPPAPAAPDATPAP